MTISGSVTVLLPGALRALFPGSPALFRCDGANVLEILALLDASWPGMRDRLCDSRPAIRRHIHIFIDGEKADLASMVRPGSEVFIITAISGG